MRKKRDGLYRRSGIFCFRYKRDGVWREKSTSSADRQQAKTFKDDWEKRNQQDELPPDRAKWPVFAICTQWVRHHAPHLSHKAAKNESSYLRQLLRHPLASKRLLMIRLEDLKDYQVDRSAHVAARPINCELGILVRVLKENHLWRGDLKNYKRLRETEGGLGEALTEEELTRLEFTAESNPKWLVPYCAELIAANTGMRGGEIKKLRLKDVDLEAMTATIEHAKSDASVRMVALNPPALAAVRKLHQRAELLGCSLAEHFLLPADLSRHTKKTDPLKGKHGFDPTRHQLSWDTAWRNLRKAAGLERLRFHTLRHTFITRAAEYGISLQVTQSIVGHVSDGVTKRYTHISDKARRAAIEKIGAERKLPRFVDVFVDEPQSEESKLLN